MACLTGSRPFSGDTLVEIRVQIELGPDPESEARLPASVRSILRRGLAVDPALRWPNMTALLDAMDATARAPTVRTRPRRWPRARWLLAAGAGVLAAGAATIAAIASTSSGRAATLRSIEADAERIGPALDATARATELRAESIATAPMLRIAIETDRTTISDVVRTEMKMTVRSGETLEIVQLVNDKPISALRMPDNGKPLQVKLERSIVLGSTGSELFVQVSEPIAGTKRRIAGALAIIEPVDLTVVRRMLAQHASEATLVGPQFEATIVPAASPRSSTPVRVAVRGSHHWGANLALLVVPRESPTRSWTRPTQLAGVAFAAVMLVLGMLRRR
jgi:hypothetical protein